MSRRGAIRRAGLIVLVGNLGLFGLKALAWWFSGSLAIGSEAINSLTDTAYSLVVVGGLYLTTQPPDVEHPHGHERIEPFVSLLIAAGILGVAAAVFYGAIRGVFIQTPSPPTGATAIVALLVTFAVKYLLYRYCLRIGQTYSSPAVRATALDNRNDLLTAGAALLGVVGAQSGYPILDPLAAGVVAVFVAHTGIEVGRRNLNYLLGAAPPESLRQQIIETALAQPEVHGVHDVVAHYVGPEVDVALHIEVEGDRTLREAHDIETRVRRTIEALDQIDDAFVHIDPQEEWKPIDSAPMNESSTDHPDAPSTSNDDSSTNGLR